MTRIIVILIPIVILTTVISLTIVKGQHKTYMYLLFLSSFSSASIALTRPDRRVGSTITFLLLAPDSLLIRASVLPFSTF